MRVCVLTDAGQVELDGIDAGCTTAQLLEAASARAPQFVPPPQAGRAVYKGLALEQDCCLSQAGLSDGDTVVVIRRREQQPPPQNSSDGTTSVPDEDTILRITTEELTKSGHLRDGSEASQPPPAQSNHTTEDLTPRLRHMENHLQQLLDAVEGLNLSIRDNRDNQGSGGDAAEGPLAEEAALPLPEPNPSLVEQLCDMGFPEEVVKKALLLTDNRLEQATEWLLEHAGDPDATTPLTEEQLRELAARRRRPRRAVADRYRPPSQASSSTPAQVVHSQPPQPHLVEQLVEMGFESGQATAALQAFGNNIEIACHWLLSSGNRPGAVPPTLNTQVAADRTDGGSSAVGDGYSNEREEGAQHASSTGADDMDDDSPYGDPGTVSDHLLNSFSSAGVQEEEDDEDDEDNDSDLPSPAIQGFLRSLGVDTGALAELLQNPIIQEALRNDRVLQAFQDMVLNPSRAPDYLSDPEVGPALLQVHRQLGSGASPPREDPENTRDSP